jgi:hypothetical protein
MVTASTVGEKGAFGIDEANVTFDYNVKAGFPGLPSLVPTVYSDPWLSWADIVY